MKLSRSSFVPRAVSLALCAAPIVAHATVETSLDAVQSKLITKIMPLAGICSLAWAGLAFLSGSESARSRLWLGIGGAVVGFGAPSIISFIQSLIH